MPQSLRDGDSAPVLKQLWREHTDQMGLLADTHEHELTKLHAAFAEQLAKQSGDHDQGAVLYLARNWPA